MLLFELAAILIVCLQLVVMTNNRQSKSDKKGQHVYKNKTRLMMIMVQFESIVLILLSIANTSLGIGLVKYPLLVNIIGLIIMVVGLLLRIYSMNELGKYYSTLLFVNTDQQLKTDGVYGIIRHPIYFADLLLYFGLGIAVSNSIVFMVMLITSIYSYVKRINVEVGMMIDSYGDQYLKYCKKTKKIVPYIY